VAASPGPGVTAKEPDGTDHDYDNVGVTVSTSDRHGLVESWCVIT
jgi:hypothetical protein